MSRILLKEWMAVGFFTEKPSALRRLPALYDQAIDMTASRFLFARRLIVRDRISAGLGTSSFDCDHASNNAASLPPNLLWYRVVEHVAPIFPTV